MFRLSMVFFTDTVEFVMSAGGGQGSGELSNVGVEAGEGGRGGGVYSSICHLQIVARECRSCPVCHALSRVHCSACIVASALSRVHCHACIVASALSRVHCRICIECHACIFYMN